MDRMNGRTTVCAYCGQRFIPSAHSNQHRRTGSNPIRTSRFCSSAHRQAAYRARRPGTPGSRTLHVTDACRVVSPDPETRAYGLRSGSREAPE